MRHRNNHLRYGLLLIALLFGTSTLATPPDELIEGSPADRLNATLGSVATIEAVFSQVTEDANGRVLQDNTGQLWFESPSSFRIETSAPFSQVLVSDGSSFWSYDEDLEQLVISDLEQDIKQVPILLLGGSEADLTRKFDVNAYEDEVAEHFILTPIGNDGLFESLSMAFKNGIPVAISITDSLGQRTRITLTNIATNQAIASSTFTFAIPAGIDVIDDRVAAVQ